MHTVGACNGPGAGVRPQTSNVLKLNARCILLSTFQKTLSLPAGGTSEASRARSCVAGPSRPGVPMLEAPSGHHPAPSSAPPIDGQARWVPWGCMIQSRSGCSRGEGELQEPETNSVQNSSVRCSNKHAGRWPIRSSLLVHDSLLPCLQNRLSTWVK